MAAVASSSEPQISDAERHAREQELKYKISPADFSKRLKSKVEIFHALVVLNSAFAQAGKGAYLIFPHPTNPGEHFTLTRKHIRSANSWFGAHIIEDKKVLTFAKKKKRTTTNPESMGSTFAPVFAADAMRAFFNNNPGGFGPLDPEEAARTQEAGTALMDMLPMAKSGRLLRNSVTMLFYLYARANGLQGEDNASLTRTDDHWKQCFGGSIPAAFYVFPVDENGKSTKITMAEAVAKGHTKIQLNTFDTIKNARPEFNQDYFNTYYFQNIAAANYFPIGWLKTIDAMKSIADELEDPAVRAQMLAEHNLIKAASSAWKRLLEPGRKLQRDANKKKKGAK
jgi:hypothetical protein